MSRSKYLALTAVIAGLSLSFALAVYCFARSNPPELIAPFSATSSHLVQYSGLLGSAPSFFYTLAVGMVVGACASSRCSGQRHVFLWTGLCSVLELTQIPVLSELLVSWLPMLMPDPAWQIIGSYWQQGVFDFIDLLATLGGGLTALSAVAYMPLESGHAAR